MKTANEKVNQLDDPDSSLSTKTASHFLWGDGCDGWWLKKSGRFTVISEAMPKGTAEIRHFHNKTEQFFYVLEGELEVEIEGLNHHLQKDDSIVVLAGSVHKVYNQSDQDVKFLVVSSPDSHEDRVNVEE